jgi:four helix bundle protein
MMQDYRKLRVWQQAHDVVLTVYAATGKFPVTESFGLTAQMRRSASSVPANIAEGCGRSSRADFARFLVIAQGSITELRYHIQLASDLGLLARPSAMDLGCRVEQVGKMLTSLVQSVREQRRVDGRRSAAEAAGQLPTAKCQRRR